MIPVEAVAALAPTVGAIVRAQEAVADDDVRALEHELTAIADALHEVTAVTFAKVNPNRYSPTYVDPVVWGKTVAPFATPSDPAVPAPSGTAIPSFTLLDVFFCRTYATKIGHGTDRARSWFASHWQAFLRSVDVPELSVPGYVRRRKDRALGGLFQEALDAYAGETGLLARHRLKTYGYLDLSFKTGAPRRSAASAGGSPSGCGIPRTASSSSPARSATPGARRRGSTCGSRRSEHGETTAPRGSATWCCTSRGRHPR